MRKKILNLPRNIIIGGIGVIFFTIVIFLWILSSNGEKDLFTCKDCNLIVIAATNVSAQHMSAYGYERITTPNIDDFAEDAILFEDTFAHESWTLPSAASVFTSQYPQTHKIFDRSKSAELTAPTLAEILTDKGFVTAAFIGGGDYHSSYGLSKGFDLYIGGGDHFAGLRDRLPLAQEWLKQRDTDKQFFLYVQGFDSHCPFNPPEPYSTKFGTSTGLLDVQTKRNFCLRGYEDYHKDQELYRTYFIQQGNPEPVDLTKADIRYLESQYDGEIAMTDNSIGSFLRDLEENGLFEDTIVVVYSEHGEMFAKHGRFGRAGAVRGTMYDDVLHVPLIIRHPKLTEGRRVSGLAQLIDFSPTILDFLGIDHTLFPSFEGRSLRPLLKGQPVNEFVYAGARFGGTIQDAFFKKTTRIDSIRNHDWKLIYEQILDEGHENWELYNISEDKEERTDLSEENPKMVQYLWEKLEQWKEEDQSVEKIDFASSSEVLPPGLIEESKKRGYW